MLDINEIKKITANDINVLHHIENDHVLLKFDMTDEMLEYFQPTFDEHSDKLMIDDCWYYFVWVEYWTDVNEIHYFLDVEQEWVEVSGDLKCDYLDNLILEVSENYIATH